jgi:hypothetical protein
VFAEHLQPGDYCAKSAGGGNEYTVLRPVEPCEDLFGRSMIRYWCRALADDREGWMTFGPHGVAYRKS